MSLGLLLTHPWPVDTWCVALYMKGPVLASFTNICSYLGLSVPQGLNLLSLWSSEAVSLGLRGPHRAIRDWKSSLDPVTLDSLLDVQRGRCRWAAAELGDLEDELGDRYQELSRSDPSR